MQRVSDSIRVLAVNLRDSKYIRQEGKGTPGEKGYRPTLWYWITPSGKKKLVDQKEAVENNFTDATIKTKLNSISKKYNGRYSDTGWNEVTKMLKEFHTVLPDITLVESAYDHDEKQNPKGKKWTYVGAFKNKETPRALWIQVTASGIGTVADPLEKYELTTVIEVLSPKNLKGKTKEVYDTLQEPS